MKTRRASLGAIFLTIVLDLLGFGLVIPFLAEEARDGFGTTAFVGALLGSVYSLMQFVFVPIWGRVSDRVGRRPVLVWSVFASALAMLGLGFGLAFGQSVMWLFVARAFGGIATANLGTATAYIADITKPEDRARGMGLVGMAFGIGFILGPAVGGLLAAKFPINGRVGPTPCFVAAALSLVNFVWVLYGLAESLPPEKRAQPARGVAPLDVARARSALRDPMLARAVLVNFLIIVAFTNLDQTFRYFNKDAFAMSPTDTGILFAFIGVIAAGVQGGLIRPLTKRHAEAPLIVLGSVVQCIAFAALVVAPSFGRFALYLASAALAFGNGITQPTVSAFVSKRAGAHEQGAVLGTNQSFAALARVIGPGFGGFVYGYDLRFPYVAGALGMAAAAAVAYSLVASAHSTRTDS